MWPQLIVENKQRVIRWIEDFEHLQVLRRVEEIKFMRDIPLFGETPIGKVYGEQIISQGINLGSCLMTRDESENVYFVWHQEFDDESSLIFVDEHYKYSFT